MERSIRRNSTALVAGTFTDTYAKGAKADARGLEPAPFRIEVRLVKVDGTWLVDDFSPVTGSATGEVGR